MGHPLWGAWASACARSVKGERPRRPPAPAGREGRNGFGDGAGDETSHAELSGCAVDAAVTVLICARTSGAGDE
jgi:hypothetical protein